MNRAWALAAPLAAVAAGVAAVLAGGRRRSGATLGAVPPFVTVGTKDSEKVPGLIPAPEGFRFQLTPTQFSKLFPGLEDLAYGDWPGPRCGKWGCAYLRPGGEVVKFTANPSEARAARRLLDDPVRGVLPVRAVYELRVKGGPRTMPIWAIVSPRFKDPGRTASAVAGCTKDFTEWRLGLVRDPLKFLVCIDDRARRRGVPLDHVHRFTERLLEAVDGMDQRGITWMDLHPGNVTQDDNGNPIILDVGPYDIDRMPGGEPKIAVLESPR